MANQRDRLGEQLILFDSSSNLMSSFQLQTKQLKQSGVVPFQLPPNKSAKATIKFSQCFQKVPCLNVVVSVDDGSELELRWTIARLTNESFELHMTNSDLDKPLVGSIHWHGSPVF